MMEGWAVVNMQWWSWLSWNGCHQYFNVGGGGGVVSGERCCCWFSWVVEPSMSMTVVVALVLVGSWAVNINGCGGWYSPSCLWDN